MSDVCQIVLVPGLDGTGTLFGPLIRALGDRFTPHIVRYRDGLQPFEAHVDDVRAVVDKIDAPLLLLGESFGGPVSVAAALRQPKQVKALCLAATFVVRPHWTTPFIRPLFRAITAPPWPHAMLTVIFRHLLADRAVDDDILYKLVQVNDHRRSALLAHRTAITGQVDQRQALACLDLPLAYIGGTADRLVPCGDHAQQIAQLRPDTAVTLIDGAPHMLLQVRSQQCAREIRKLARSARLLNSDLA